MKVWSSWLFIWTLESLVKPVAVAKPRVLGTLAIDLADNIVDRGYLKETKQERKNEMESKKEEKLLLYYWNQQFN